MAPKGETVAPTIPVEALDSRNTSKTPRGTYIAVAMLFAFASSVITAQPRPSVGLTVRGTPEFALKKGDQGEYMVYDFISDGNTIAIRLEVDRSRSSNSVSGRWSKVLLESTSVALRLSTPKAVFAEADEKGGLLFPETTLTCVITPINRAPESNSYRLQCVAADERQRWMKGDEMVFEMSIAVITKRGSPIDVLLLSNVSEPLSVWIE